MKKIIYIFLLIGFGLNAQSNLLFKTDFEGTVFLGNDIGGWKYFSGSSFIDGVEYTFPTDGQLGMGTSNNAVHMIDGNGGDISADLVNVIGHNGVSTTVLNQKVTKWGANSTQTPWQFNNITTEPDEFYMSYWQKVDANFVFNVGAGDYTWRSMWQFKTKNWFKNDGSGARLSFNAYQFGKNNFIYRLELDDRILNSNDDGLIWRSQSVPQDMPRDEWFKFEIYIKYRRDATGAAWVKINGVKVCEIDNVSMTVNNDPLLFFMAPTLYGADDNMEQWIDDVEIWDGIPDQVSANAGEDKTICENESVTLTASGGSTYLWSTGATTASITVSPTSTQTYTVTATDGSGNSDTDDVIVTVNSVTANAGADITIDEGNSTTLTASGGDTYLWSTGATTASITVSPNTTTNYTVTATANGCEDTASVQITVNQNTGSVTANAGSDLSICTGESTILTASGGTSYAWSTGATTASITVSPTSTQTYTVTATDGSGNSDSDDVIVTVNSVTANAGVDITIDEGNSTTLTASGGDTYLWSTGATTASITVSPNTTTNYTVTATANGCEDTASVQITVNQNTGSGSITANAGSDVSICIGENTILTASGGTSYTWNTGATTASITVNPTSTQTYTVTATDGSGNSDSDDVIVTVNSVTANAGVDQTINEGDGASLKASGGDTYLWSTGATTQSITVSPVDTKTFTVTVYKNGCEDIDTVLITVIPNDVTNPPPAKANAGEDFTICLGESASLTAYGGTNYVWSTGDESKNIQVSPTRTTTYSLTAIRGGVTDIDTVTITVENCSNSLSSIDSENSNMIVYPNPSDGNIHIKIDKVAKDSNILINDSKGSLIYFEEVNNDVDKFSREIDLSLFADGIYFVRLLSNDQNLIKKLIII